MTMEKKKTVFDYAAQILMIFGLMVLFLSVCSYFAGDDGKNHSTLFSLGAEGMSMASLVQMLGLSVLTTFIRALFLSDRILKKLSATARTIGMIISCIAVIIVFVILFDWFPSDNVLAWILFALSFGVCFTLSLCITISRQKKENEAMAKALERLKNED